MPLDASARIQAASGTVDPAASSFTPALPNPTTDGSTLLLWFATASGGSVIIQNQSFDPPFFQDGLHTSQWYAWRRDNQPPGETSWPVTAQSSGRWSWRIEEWAGLSTVGQPDAMTTGETQNNGLQANHTSTTSACTPDTGDYAALAVFRAGAGTAIWPAARTYSSGWSEVDALAVGDGSGSTDFLLLIAEAYPGVITSLDAVMTWDNTGGGTYTDKVVLGWMACYQPAAPPPALGVLASP